jgi:hypothetical protein
MNVFRFTALAVRLAAGLGVAACSLAQASGPTDREWNTWPFLVRYQEPAGSSSWTGAGPFLFRKPNADADGNTASGFRPFWVQLHNPQGEFRAGYLLYPLFSYTRDENTYKWSVFELVRNWDRRRSAGAPTSIFDQRGEFEIFPFWFSRQSGDPELSYRALFPLYGTVKNKLGFERLSWTLFPFYVENEKRGAVTTSVPWPIVRITRGAAHGWGVWPLFNYVDRPGVSRYETYLWPLGFNATRYPTPDDPPGTQPRRDIGALPFYARNTGPGYINEDFLWPFFGYTDRTLPKVYHERRFLWPIVVLGRGDDRNVTRIAPLYTHSVVKGYDKHWFLWPLLRHAKWSDLDVARTRTQLLYFLYWNEEQQPVGRSPSAAAQLTHVWPLFSNWDNGAGRRQWQLFSPLDVFFPSNEKIRHVWSPIFAIARHEQRSPGDTRTSLLWNAITWEERAAEQRSEFHLGPLVGVTRQAGEQHIAIGNGLLSLRRSDGGRWRVLWLDFPPKAVSNTPAPR